MDRWHRIFECESGKLLCVRVEHRVGSDEESTGSWLNQFREEGVEVGFGVGIQHLKVQSQKCGRMPLRLS